VPSDYAQSRYDQVAPDYDRLWSRYMEAPQARLTAGLRLSAGERLADIACGTGVITLEMARQSRPGEVVAVDYSENMLAAAERRLLSEGIAPRLVHAQAEQFVDSAARASFDVISCRFALAYVDWRTMLPRIGLPAPAPGPRGHRERHLRLHPQAFKVYEDLRDSPRTVWKLMQHFGKDVGRAWALYRSLRQTFGTTRFIPVPDDPEQVAALLEQGGLRRREAWTETVHLWFASGRGRRGLARGIGLCHPSRTGARSREGSPLPEGDLRLRAGGPREPQGVPLDIVVSGVIAGAGLSAALRPPSGRHGTVDLTPETGRILGGGVIDEGVPERSGRAALGRPPLLPP
jgi:SAM-dependent methyltransferase